MNKAGDGKKVYREDEFCPKCGAHLAASGICLNACHMSDKSRERFGRLLAAAYNEAQSRKTP
jgi:ribosomal protein S27AE